MKMMRRPGRDGGRKGGREGMDFRKVRKAGGGAWVFPR